ncbi:hypothetical protein BC835DRAFT_1528384 [Cytidiella melzeri]|nr:hypothetical protein BC835DRAFT_1528384 [Cytidiella melzeri]
MPNMRLRNRRPVGDKPAGDTPRATGKRKASGTPGAQEKFAEIASLRKLPALNINSVADDDANTQRSQLPSKALAESTPLPARLQRRPLATLPGPSKLPSRQHYSPLPPSSPPSASSDDLEYENAPTTTRPQALLTPPSEPSEAGDDSYLEHENKENELEDCVGKLAMPEPPEDQVGVTHDKESSEDDPFGFSILERRLKSQRHAKRRSFVSPPQALPIKKGKEPERPRAPLGELSFEREASTSTLKLRHPTPYHASDDLEDMYLDPNELPKSAPADEDDENANFSPPTGLEGMEAEMDDEEEAELAREEQRRYKGKAKAKALEPASSVSEIDPLRTPKPRHVANIYPLRSPFSSVEGTPCDRSLADSPLSSPSPMKPLTVLHTLPVFSVKTGSSPVKAKVGPRPLVELPSSKRRRITLGKENSLVIDRDDSEDPLMVAKNLEKLLPKRPVVRRSGRISKAVNTVAPKATASSKKGGVVQAEPVLQKRGRGRPPKKTEVYVPDITSHLEPSEEDESPEQSPVVTRKRGAPVAKDTPTKKAKTQRAKLSRAAPTSKRGSSSNNTRARAKAASKGKGKAKAKPVAFEPEDSDEARKREERIAFFKRLDETSLEKEDVYVI